MAVSKNSQPTLIAAKRELRRFADPKKKDLLQRYFKTGPGDYAEGDVFLGVIVPLTRAVAREFGELRLSDLRVLLKSKIHEERLLALLILGRQFTRSKSALDQEKIYNFVMNNRAGINNWDLVDTAAPTIIGRYWLQSEKISDQKKLLRSKTLWDKRIAIVGLFPLMRAKKETHLTPTLTTSLKFEHDLLHKAAGWLLRDWIKSGSATARQFLEQNCQKMPRTTLRYAIEHQSELERRRLMAKR